MTKALPFLCVLFLGCNDTALTAGPAPGASTDTNPSTNPLPGEHTDPAPGPSGQACIVGDWRVVSTSRGEPGGIIRFMPQGDFNVWAPGLTQVAPPTGTGSYRYLQVDGTDLGFPTPQLAIDSSNGLNCDEDAVFRISETADCKKLWLTATIDNCTGARFYLDGEVYLEAL